MMFYALTMKRSFSQAGGKKALCGISYPTVLIITTIAIGLLLLLLLFLPYYAYAHFFGKTIDIGGNNGFQVVFAPYPATPVGDNNSTTMLNFSVLQKGANLYNINSAVVITDKKTGELVAQIPYKQYETSDITIPYTFKKIGDYVVTIQTRIPGDATYQSNPLVASFDLSVVSQIQTILSDKYTIGYIVIAAIASVCGAIAVRAWRKIREE
jgi:hypothetical protein